MEKLYTEKEYAQKAAEANNLGKKLYINTYSVEYEADVLDFEDVETERQIPVFNENGEQKTDEDGNFIYETETEIIKKPVMIEKTETDEEGNEYTVQVQSSHKETKTKEVAKLVIADDGYYVCYKDNYTDGTVTEDFEAQKLSEIKERKHLENTQKAKLAVENGYVVFKEAEFETNAQTVGDLTAAMLMLQAQQNTRHSEQSEESVLDSSVVSLPQNDNITYTWLSKDDKAVELTLEDFVTLGNLIAEYKNTIWSNKYLSFKTAIEQAQTIEELERININYDDINV